MKKILTFSILSAVAFSFTACKKDFLETKPTAVVSTAPPEVRLNGLYLMTYQPGTGGTSGHTDFGQKKHRYLYRYALWRYGAIRGYL